MGKTPPPFAVGSEITGAPGKLPGIEWSPKPGNPAGDNCCFRPVPFPGGNIRVAPWLADGLREALSNKRVTGNSGRLNVVNVFLCWHIRCCFSRHGGRAGP